MNIRSTQPSGSDFSRTRLNGIDAPGCASQPEYRSPTGISTATVLPGPANGQAHAGS